MSKDVNKEVLFGKTLTAVKKKAKEQGNVISEKEVEEAFRDLELDREQLAMVYDSLKNNKIGIGEEVDSDAYLEEEDKNFLEIYLEELKALPAVSEGEKLAVTLSAMAGDISAKKQLITFYLPEAAQLAKLYAGQGVLLEDLIGEANVALTVGVEMLGALEKAEEVPGMLGKMMMDAMENSIGEVADSEEAGKAVAEKVNRVADAAKELSEDLRRKVTVEELAEETQISQEDIREAVRLSGRKIEEIEDEK